MNKTALILLLLLSSCATQPTKIVWHDGREIVIKSDGDSLVTVKLRDGKEIVGEVTVDTRKSSIIRDFIKLMMLKMFSDTNTGARK